MAKRQSQTLEKDVQNEILQYLERIGIYAWKNDSVGIFDPRTRKFRKATSRFKRRGISDILGVANDGSGRIIGIEVKRPGSNRVTPEQKEFIAHIQAAQGIAFVAHSVDEVRTALAQVGLV